MKIAPAIVAIFICLCETIPELHSQGFIVPNGVVVNFDGLFFPGEIDVLHNPAAPTSGGSYTGFLFNPINSNTFQFMAVVDVGVRVFFVSPNDPVSLQPILAQNYTELGFQPSYVFDDGVPFYVGLYTGNQQNAPLDGIYPDPLFGWAELVNNNGAIELLDSGLEYQGGGIVAGTLNIIPVPEPATFALFTTGAVLLALRRSRK
jgi:hypothetical protein